MRVAELLTYVPPETEREVQETFNRYGAKIRDVVAKAIRLPFTWEVAESSGKLACSCTVRVDEIGLPETVSRLEIDDAVLFENSAVLPGRGRPQQLRRDS